MISDLSDPEVIELRSTLINRVGELRAQAVIIDVRALDVIDSFVARCLRSIALTAKLKGAETIVVGIQPDVAIAIVHFDLDLTPIHAALDLDEAFMILEHQIEGNHEDGR